MLVSVTGYRGSLGDELRYRDSTNPTPGLWLHLLLLRVPAETGKIPWGRLRQGMAEGADKQENTYEVNKFISEVFKTCVSDMDNP